MLDAVFISDLHLHPENLVITHRFNQFIDWAATNTLSLYILGDFFHAWAGDDGIDDWSLGIAKRLKWLSQQGVTIYFMHGNRDFLLGRFFAEKSGMTVLPEPSVIELNKTAILLVHGDRYCTKDKAHQWLRRLTRNRFFPRLFLSFPLSLRKKMVMGIRKISQSNRRQPSDNMNVVDKDLLMHMKQHKVTTLIHGHTHQPGLTEHLISGALYQQYILSDWDDSPQLLCYDDSMGFYFEQFLSC